jgi:dihydropyrimidinase
MEKSFDVLLVGGVIVTGRGIRIADVGVRGEAIAAVEPNLCRDAAREVLDVTGKYIFPGVVDVHVHPVYVDNVEDCSRIAAYGGTTTLLHFAYARPGESLVERVELLLEEGLRHSLLDFGLHGGVFEASLQVPEIATVMEMGIRTFKFFLTYLKQGWYTDDYQLIRAMDILAERGGMAMVHAENGGGIDYLEDKYLKGPSASPANFNATRPAALEEEAVFHQGWNWDANGPTGFASAARATRIGIGAYPIYTSNEEELGPGT